MMDSTHVKAEKIEDDLFVLRPDHFNWPFSANVYVITDHKGFSMIDLGCGGPLCLERIKGGLSQLNLSLDRLHTLVLSHAHPDHMGAASIFLEETSPVVMIHKDDLEQAKNPQRLARTFDIEFVHDLLDIGSDNLMDIMNYFNDTGCSMSEAIEPQRALDEGDIISLGRYFFEVIHTPGHSPGHISLYDKETGILYSGDLAGEVVPWYTPASGGVIGYMTSLEKMEKRNSRLIIPSHGGIINKPVEKIEEVRNRLLARDKKMMDILKEGKLNFVEINNRMYSNEIIRTFPGAGITESHIQKLISDGRARRVGDKVEAV